MPLPLSGFPRMLLYGKIYFPVARNYAVAANDVVVLYFVRTGSFFLFFSVWAIEAEVITLQRER